MDRNANLFNTLHGGLQINVTNAIFTHGERDPLRALGIQNDPNESSPVFIVPGKSNEICILVDEIKKICPLSRILRVDTV